MRGRGEPRPRGTGGNWRVRGGEGVLAGGGGEGEGEGGRVGGGGWGSIEGAVPLGGGTPGDLLARAPAWPARPGRCCTGPSPLTTRLPHLAPLTTQPYSAPPHCTHHTAPHLTPRAEVPPPATAPPAGAAPLAFGAASLAPQSQVLGEDGGSTPSPQRTAHKHSSTPPTPRAVAHPPPGTPAGVAAQRPAQSRRLGPPQRFWCRIWCSSRARTGATRRHQGGATRR